MSVSTIILFILFIGLPPLSYIKQIYDECMEVINTNNPIFILSKNEYREALNIRYENIFHCPQGEEYYKYQIVLQRLQQSRNIFFNQKLKGLPQLPVIYIIFQDGGHSTETWEEYQLRVKVTIKKIMNDWTQSIKKRNAMYFYSEVKTKDNITFEFLTPETIEE